MNSKTTPKTSKKTTKKAPGSRKGTPPNTTAKDTKPRTKGAHTATPAHTVATSETPGETLAQLADSYLHHLAEIGKSPATVFSYRMDLAIARAHFGDETPAERLTAEKVGEFFDSPAVTQRKNGTPKTEITIKKTRRVLRQALVWAKEKGLIDEVPLPIPTAK